MVLRWIRVTCQIISRKQSK